MQVERKTESLKSSTLDRVKAFLPQLSKANESLSATEAEIVTIVDKTAEDSDDSETDTPKDSYIEMNLGLYQYNSESDSDATTSSSEDSNESEEEEVKNPSQLEVKEKVAKAKKLRLPKKKKKLDSAKKTLIEELPEVTTGEPTQPD